MRLEAVLLSLLLWEASGAPRKKRDIGAVEHEHPHHAVSFFDSFFSFFGGGSDSSPITSAREQDQTPKLPDFVPARGPRPLEAPSVFRHPPEAEQQQPAGPVQQPPRPPTQFQQLPVVPQFRPTTAPSSPQSTPDVPFRQPQTPHQHPQPFDQMQFQRGQQGAAWSTSAPARPPASTTLFYSTPLASGFLPPEFARQGRVEFESVPQAPNFAAEPSQQLPQRPGGQQQQQQWRPAEAAGTPPRSSLLPSAPVPPPAALPGFHHHQTVPGRFPWTAPSPVAKANFTLSTLPPGIVPPMRIPNRPRHVAPARSPKLPGQSNLPRLPGEPSFRPTRVRNNQNSNSIVPLATLTDPETCYSGGEVGQCSPAMQCHQHGGRVGAPCMGSGWQPRVCCVFEQRRCGFQSSHRVSNFKSTPGEVAPPASCGYRVNLLPKVCQVRLDFIDLQTKPMSHGLCDPNNQLKISVGPGQVARVPVSQLCGNVAREGERPTLSTDLPHIYVHFDRRQKKEGWTQPAYLQLEMKSAGLPSSWNIRVSQVTCDAPRLQAPRGCNQWYTSLTGTITSLGFSGGQYQANQDITACVASDPGACGIQYEMKALQVGPTKGASLGYGLVCTDYIKFLGEKTSVCGGARDLSMVLPARGPLGFTFRSDDKHVMGSDVGYSIGFKLLQDCSNVTFYQYPGGRSSNRV